MSADHFTSNGDIFLEAAVGPQPRLRFLVDSILLKIISPVFATMFTLPQPPAQAHNGQPVIPTINIHDPPEALRAFLQYLYRLPNPLDTDFLTLAALFTMAIKYEMEELQTVLRERLEQLSSDDPFAAFIVACSHGLPETAKKVLRISTPRSYQKRDYSEEMQAIAHMDIFRFLRFVDLREGQGQSIILDISAWSPLNHLAHFSCADTFKHWFQAKSFYLRLAKVLEERFTDDPCIGVESLYWLAGTVSPPHGCPLNAVQQQPPGTIPPPFLCPARQEWIRGCIEELSCQLDALRSDLEVRLL